MDVTRAHSERECELPDPLIHNEHADILTTHVKTDHRHIFEVQCLQDEKSRTFERTAQS